VTARVEAEGHGLKNEHVTKEVGRSTKAEVPSEGEVGAREEFFSANGRNGENRG
jgi:hypothetical protein